MECVLIAIIITIMIILLLFLRSCADPYVNDATFALSMVFLEELGATGNKVRRCLLHEHDFPMCPLHLPFAAFCIATCSLHAPVLPHYELYQTVMYK